MFLMIFLVNYADKKRIFSTDFTGTFAISLATMRSRP